MKKILLAFMLCVSTYCIQAQTLVGAPDGFAAVGNVTGGAGGRVVYPTTADSLSAYMDSDEALTIVIRGTIDLGSSMHTLRSNKTIIGEGSNAKITNGGLESGNKYSNIIIQNIEFVHSPDDLIKIYGAQRFWVDHCTFSDGDSVDESVDGLFDITNAANYITISNCKFFNHSKNILIGAKDGNTADTVTKVTIHGNWFKGTYQRNPRVRFGRVHCYNNYYDANTIYSVVSACDAMVVLENNYFLNVTYPIQIGYDDSPAGKVDTINNVFVGCGATLISNGETGSKGAAVTGYEHDWSPKTAYDYTPIAPENVPAYVMANAGVFGSGVGVKQAGLEMSRQSAGAFQIKELSKNSFKVTGADCASMYNVSGKVVGTVGVLSNASQGITFNTTGLKNGTYFIVARTGTARAAQKLVLVK